MTHTKTLDTLYLEPSAAGSLGGVDALLRSAKQHQPLIKRKEVVEYLKSTPAYTLHKPYFKKYPRRRIVVGGIDKQWQADLADMNSVITENKGARYILTVIDCFSKYAWAIPVSNKSGKVVSEGIQKILQTSAPRKPTRIQTDKGKEFF